jgi:hypothetical protein
MTIHIKPIPKSQSQQPSIEATELADQMNFGGSPGTLVQVIASQNPGFLLAIFDDGQS